MIYYKFVLDIKAKANSQRFLTQSRLHSFDCSLGEVLKIIRAFEVNKAHGHRRVTSGGKGEGPPLPFLFKTERKCPDFIHLWIKFLI